MFDDYELRGSLWKQKVSAILGSLLLGSFALWAAVFMFELTWGTNPIAMAFAKTIQIQTTLP